MAPKNTEDTMIRLLKIQAYNSTVQLAIELHKNKIPLSYIGKQCDYFGIDIQGLSERLQGIRS